MIDLVTSLLDCFFNLVQNRNLKYKKEEKKKELRWWRRFTMKHKKKKKKVDGLRRHFVVCVSI